MIHWHYMMEFLRLLLYLQNIVGVQFHLPTIHRPTWLSFTFKLTALWQELDLNWNTPQAVSAIQLKCKLVFNVLILEFEHFQGICSLMCESTSYLREQQQYDIWIAIHQVTNSNWVLDCWISNLWVIILLIQRYLRPLNFFAHSIAANYEVKKHVYDKNIYKSKKMLKLFVF